jgi:L-seryl-tRNA(Ser) seleniumtransferase
MMKELLRKIPKVDEILRHAHWRDVEQYGENTAKESLRAVLNELREAIREGRADKLPGHEQIIAEAKQRAADALAPKLKRVINATGIVIHTNLGRSPLSRRAIERLLAVAAGYSNLEYDLNAGARGDRHAHCVALVRKLTGAEGALVVNNNAAAVLLVLNTLAEGKEVIIGRGELIEIGGSFRIPEVMRKSGAVLCEVGTTNRTFREDYEQAINERTGLIMKAHTSNYRIKGFVHETTSEELAELAAGRSIPFYFDAGSGLFASVGLRDATEPAILDETRKGLDVISFSGDKLLGGPQAGIIVGKAPFIDAMRKNPLTRALRPDKFTLAALEATLVAYTEPERAKEEIPILRMLHQDGTMLKRRAARVGRALAKAAGNVAVDVVPLSSEVGGGSLPDVQIPSVGLALVPGKISVDELERRMRKADVPIIARIEKERLLIDMRTVQEEDERELVSGIAAALRHGE